MDSVMGDGMSSFTDYERLVEAEDLVAFTNDWGIKNPKRDFSNGMPGMLLWLVELVGWVTGWLSSWLVACLVWFDLIDRMDGWTDGWMDGWLDGRMDGWTARTSNPPIHQLCIQSCTVCRTENVDAKVSNELWRPSLLKTNMPPKKWWLENEFSF